MVNEAALLATRRSSPSIDMADLSEAVERVVSRPSRRSRILTADDRRRIAVHEAGHALVAAAQPGAAPVMKVSVLARGHAGGSTLQAPEGDRVLATRTELTARIAILMGGWAAERACLGEASTGSNDDLARATELARRMVWECGMGERFGPLAISQAGLAGDGSSPPWSEATAAAIDTETRAIVDGACECAMRVVSANAPLLEAMAADLMRAERPGGRRAAGFPHADQAIRRHGVRPRPRVLMGKPRSAVATPAGGLLVEYLRSRRVVRRVNRQHGHDDVVEMPLAAFVSGLGLEAADLVPTRHYLLFAGTGRGAAGGLRDLCGAYDSEERARAAFRELRLSKAFTGGWAELVVVRSGRRIEPVCWFGRGASDATDWDHRAGDQPRQRTAPAAPRLRRWRR